MKVLLAEDDRKLAQLISKGLKRMSYAVETVHDGRAALNRMQKNSYDVAILDVMMPEIDGLEVCRQVRELRIETPVIILSSRGAVDDKVKGLDVGADDYLAKPFSLEELKARMRAAVRRKNPYNVPVMEVGDISLDVNRGMVFCGGRPVELSGRKYQILEYLMHHKGQILTRDQIHEGVWGESTLVVSNSVDVHVSHLRKKLEEFSPKRSILSIRGRGYLMEG